MASIISKIADVFKPKQGDLVTENTLGVRTSSDAPQQTTTPNPVSSPIPANVPIKSRSEPGNKPLYQPTGLLSSRAAQNDAKVGNTYDKIEDKGFKSYLSTYYKTLDDKEHTRMYTDLEQYSALGGSFDTNFRKRYTEDRAKLDKELEEAKKTYGAQSDEYKALQQFSEDYDKLGTQAKLRVAGGQAAQVSRQLDDTIDSVFAGYMSDPGFQEKVEKGKKEILGNPRKYALFTKGMEGATEKQKDLLYAIFIDEDEEGAKDFYRRFLNPTVAQVGAAQDFIKEQGSGSKADKIWAGIGAALGGAVANDQILNGSLKKAVDAITGKSAPLDTDELVKLGENGSFTVGDAVDYHLKQEFAALDQKDLDTYGLAGFNQMVANLGDSEWAALAKEKATDYQKQLLGYIYLASEGDEAAAKEFWESINTWGQQIQQAVNGDTYGTTSKDAIKSSLYQDYIDRNEAVSNLYKIAVTTGSQLSRTALSFIPVIGQALSLGTMAVGIFGDVYNATMAEGYGRGTSAGYAASKAALELVSEACFGSVLKVPGLVANAAGKAFVRNVTSPALRFGIRMANRFGEEGFEEYGTELLDPLITNLWLGEGDLSQRLKEGLEGMDPLADQNVEAFMLGGASALLLGGAGEVYNIQYERAYADFGKALNMENATSKLVDEILNNPLTLEEAKAKFDSDAKKKVELYEEAAKLAQGIKSGKYKATDYNVGEMYIKFGQSGGDVSWLTNPDTVSYSKDTLTLENYIAGATSMLSEIGGDVTLAESIAKIAMGESVSADIQKTIQNDEKAFTVLSQLLGDLDMDVDSALTRAAKSTTRNVSGNTTYDTLVAENTSQTVANPAASELYKSGMSWEDASEIGAVIEKVQNGQTITEEEAELVAVSNAAVRATLSSMLGVELDEAATIGTVLQELNNAAQQITEIKAQQAAVREGAEARARLPIPVNGAQTSTIGGVEISHDDFIDKYMKQHGVSQEVAEQAWQQRVSVNNALYGQEESNGRGTIPRNNEGRDVTVAPGGTVQEGTERGDQLGRSSDAGGRGGSGGAVELGSRAGEAKSSGTAEVITKFNSEQRRFMQTCRDDGFASVTLVRGPLLNDAGQEVNVKVDGKGNLTIRWDNPIVSPWRVELHEKLHRWLDAMGANREAYVFSALMDILDGDVDKINELFKAYAKRYRRAYAGLSGPAFADAVYEEILADMYAGMDLYHTGVDAYQNVAEMYIMQSGLQDKFFGNDVDVDYSGGANRFDLADPFYGSTDWELPADTRPFPGEKPMHDQLKRFSLSSMAEGGNFELETNEAGYPFALIDKSTGKRVEHVTADMMRDTPLGDVVKMAVKSEGNPAGTISEREADTQLQMLADAMNLIVEYKDAAVVWEMVGSQLFSAIKSNSDKQYNKTIDFSTICKKTMAIVDAMSETMKRLGRGLTRREVEMVYEETGKAGEATPCPVCYVFSRWMGIGNLLDQIRVFQENYAGKSEEELVSFMTGIEEQARAYAEAASESKKADFYDKNGKLKIGKVLSDMKNKPNSRAASAIKKLNQNRQAAIAINELTKAMENTTPEQASRYRALIKKLKGSLLNAKQIQLYEEQMASADAEVEPIEAYQWLAKTAMMTDMSEVNEDGEAIGNWKKNPKYKPVPNDILFDLNQGGEFADKYPLTWAFRTGKGCAMGKAITPYADARVGETIQGVALSDVKEIRVGDLNEFLNGDTKKQLKTLESARKKMKRQNLIGGMRYQSTSDFRYEFGSDYLMTFFEMQALGANVQLYTKVIESVDFLASTGADCNLSVMPLGDGYTIDPESGEMKLAFSNVTGINAEAAIKKAKQYDNVQLILVGINDTNIRLALEGTDVTFVIPFHGSGQSVHQVQTLMDLIGEHLDVTQAQDYTSVQSDHVSKNQTAEQKAMWDLRMAIIMGECQNGLTAEQQALLAKNQHLQKLYDMFYVNESDPAYQNFLAKDQAEHIFPYEYWNKDGDYEHADENGRIFQEYCASMGVIPRFSGINSKGEKVDFGDFTKDKGYWKLLIDRSMYENLYDANGDWIGYGKYRGQKQINMSDVKISDLDPKTGEAQFINGEMSKQYDATRNPADLEKRNTIVDRAVQRIEAARDSGDVFDQTQVNKGFRTTIMGAQSALRERMSVAPEDLTEKQQANVEFNNRQTDVGGELRHLSGDKQKRYKNSVGKEVGGKIFVHKQYADEVVQDPELLDNAEAALKEAYPDFEYNCITYDPKTGSIRFDEAPDFDTADEPIPGWQITVTRDGTVKKPHYESQIWHHKWQWVKNDYTGFDVEDSWDRSRQYLNHLRPVAMSDYRFSNSKNSEKGSFAQRGIPDARVWGEQLRHFGLEDMIRDERWKNPAQAKTAPATRYSLSLGDPGFESGNKEAPVTDKRGQVLYVEPSTDAWSVARDADGSLLNTQYLQDELGLNIYDNPQDEYKPEKRGVIPKAGDAAHMTANKSTEPSYIQAFDYLRQTGKEGARVLDASSGMGHGVQYGRGLKTEDGKPMFDVVDLEPFSGSRPVDFKKYGGLIAAIEAGEEEPFDFIISNAVINVMAQDAREELLGNLLRMLKPGGELFINPADTGAPVNPLTLEEFHALKDAGENVSGRNVILVPASKGVGREVYVANKKTIQKAYGATEFKAFAKDVAKQALGEDIKIENGNKLPGLNKGFVITRSETTKPRRYSVAQEGEASGQSTERFSVAPNEEIVTYINDGHYENGDTISFIDEILDGRKKGETRSHKSLTRKWTGLGKDGMVYGRARFGDPVPLVKGSQEYKDSLIEGTDYDIEDGGKPKYYYPVLETEDFRDNPKPITSNGNYGKYERFSIAPNDSAFEAPYTSEADWRKAVKDRSIEYTSDMEERWGLSEGDMIDCDAAITELLDRIDEIKARIKNGGKWYQNDIFGLHWFKEGFTDFIDLMKSRNGEDMLRFMLRNVDEKSLQDLKWFPIHVFSSDVRTKFRKEINKFNKIIDERLKEISANKPHIGRDLGVSSRKTYNLSEIRSMFEELNSNEETGAIAKKVFDWAEKMESAGFPIPFKFRTLTDAEGKQWGGKVKYDTKSFNNPDISDARKAETLLHEMIHVYSAYAIDLVHGNDSTGGLYQYYSNGPQLRDAYQALPADVVEAVRTLDDIYKEIRYDPLFVRKNGTKMYGVTNTYEMIAELSNPEFRAALKKKSLLQRILDAVKKLFGIETTNAYDSVSAAFDKLMTSSADADLRNKYVRYMETQDKYDRFSVAPSDDSGSNNPYPAGSLENTVYDLLGRADNPQALQDWVNGLREEQRKNAEWKTTPPTIPAKDRATPVNKVQKEIQQNQLQKLIEKYGAFEKGEKPARDVSIPQQTSDDNRVGRFTRTAAEANGIPERMVDQITNELLTSDLLTYARISDSAAIARADAEFNQYGYKRAIKEWEGKASVEHNPTKYDVVFGERLMIEAARNGDDAVAMKVLADLTAMVRQSGQVSQAASLLKKLGPTGQLYYIQKAVDRLNKQNQGRIAKGKMDPIVINQDLAKAVLLAESREEIDKAMEALIEDIANKIPVTMKDKWDAWRYLAMLGNTRTHFRNIVGNAIFSPIRFTKDILAAAGEKALIRDKAERTKDVGARVGGRKYAKIREFAAADFKEMQPQIVGTGKMNPLNEILSKRKIFKHLKILNKASDINSDLLDREDIVFLRSAYINAMTQFIAARGLSLEDLSNTFEGAKMLNEARAYAALEAQKATYRDFNSLATFLNGMKRAPGVGWLIDGILPFTKTPANILRRGIEYSPIGLAKGLYNMLYSVQKGDMTAAEAIDHTAAGMTGSMIAMLGWFLAAKGLARGGGDDDEKKDALEKAQGHQNYSLEIDGKSYTIDWAAPVALPFFVGVEAFNQLTKGGPLSFWDFANVASLIAEPMLSLSMLDGLNSTLASVRYGDQNEALKTIVGNMAQSYFSQGVPTVGGQIARTIDPDRRSTYVDKNSKVPAALQRFVQGAQAKVPNVFGLMPNASDKMAYVDVWGRKDTSENVVLRGLENFLSPGYGNKINETPIDKELMRLYDATGDSSVLPSVVAKYFQVEGERLDLTAKQYEEYKTKAGQTAFSLLGDLMDDVAYIAMDDTQKAAVVGKILNAATVIGKKAVAPTYKADTWIERAIAQDNVETAAMYQTLKGLGTGLSDYQLISSMDWLTDQQRGTLVMEARSNTERNMTDYTKKKYKFVLTDDQIKREREIYEEMFWPAYTELIYSQKYINAGIAERASMISDMQSDLGKASRSQLGDELRAEGITSVLLDDSDVPEQVTNLYDILNRG